MRVAAVQKLFDQTALRMLALDRDIACATATDLVEDQATLERSSALRCAAGQAAARIVDQAILREVVLCDQTARRGPQLAV